MLKDIASAYNFLPLAVERLRTSLFDCLDNTGDAGDGEFGGAGGSGSGDHMGCKAESRVRMLLKHGGESLANATNQAGLTPLFIAVKSRASAEVVQTLLEFGADSNAVDAHGTPLAVFPLLRHGSEALKVGRA